MNIRDKILVVEDEKSISGFIKTILTGNGYDVILAHTGAEAFSMISSHCPDLVVLDRDFDIEKVFVAGKERYARS